ncbi:MAG: glycosyltransferase family 4 protein [Sulfurimonas sp.]|nr:glycosyltransferase family 4 protein [Sulfurimonas sp.]MBU3938880.1 glycosyltransferase family 4 protein [bacterium]MBU4059846.1 glycosyltransferase family 4 protein [bacterium]
MKTLFCVRHNFYDAPGGAQIQILKTKEYLEKLGVSCDITTTPYHVNFNKYDILHLTDLTWVYDNIVYFEEIKKQNFKGKKVLSTIYWPFDDYASKGAPFFQKLIFKIFGINGFEFAKAFAKFIFKKEKIYLKGLKKSYIQIQREIAQSVDWLLPNAELEMQALNDRLGLNLKNYSVANNAIDTIIFDKIMAESNIKKDNNLITFVARIDARKNQLNFLKAMMDTDYKIRFIGNAGPNSQSYLERLKELANARGNVEFISHIPQEEVFKHMLEAKVNVLTSWIETPGLVSLEAAYARCNIVVSKKGSVRDYFRDFAFYCDPENIDEIKSQVIKALSADFDDRFIDLIKEEYSWEKTAEQTLEAYKRVLNEKN